MRCPHQYLTHLVIKHNQFPMHVKYWSVHYMTGSYAISSHMCPKTARNSLYYKKVTDGYRWLQMIFGICNRIITYPIRSYEVATDGYR